jgi:hypothetical protein
MAADQPLGLGIARSRAAFGLAEPGEQIVDDVAFVLIHPRPSVALLEMASRRTLSSDREKRSSSRRDRRETIALGR